MNMQRKKVEEGAGAEEVEEALERGHLMSKKKKNDLERHPDWLAQLLMNYVHKIYSQIKEIFTKILQKPSH